MNSLPSKPTTVATSLTGRPLSLSKKSLKSLPSGPVTLTTAAGLSPTFSSPAASILNPLPLA